MNNLTRLFVFVFVLALMVGSVGCGPAEPEAATVRVLAMEQAGPTVEEMNAIFVVNE